MLSSGLGREKSLSLGCSGKGETQNKQNLSLPKGSQVEWKMWFKDTEILFVIMDRETGHGPRLGQQYKYNLLSTLRGCLRSPTTSPRQILLPYRCLDRRQWTPSCG